MDTFVSNTSELISRVYADLLSNFRNMVWLSKYCILAPLNKIIHTINTALEASCLMTVLSTCPWTQFLMNLKQFIFQ